MHCCAIRKVNTSVGRRMSSEMFFVVITSLFVGLTQAVAVTTTDSPSGLQTEQSAPPSKVQNCRESCLDKFGTEDFACLQEPECSMCWDGCAMSPSSISAVEETLQLKITSMYQQGSLVSANVGWPSTNAPSQCLITWEVDGGGLTGNLLTDSSSVQLSLWPETKYSVRVTCKNKKTDEITRSSSLTIDTNFAIPLDHEESTAAPTTIRIPDTTTTRIPSTTFTTENYLDKLEKNIHEILVNNIDKERKEMEQQLRHRKVHKGIYGKPHQEYYEDVDETDLESLDLEHLEHFHGMNTNTKVDLWDILEGRTEIALGICAALSLFLVILIGLVFKMRRTRLVQEKESLIENQMESGLLPVALANHSNTATQTTTIHV